MKPILNDPAKAHDYFRAKLEFTTGPVELAHMLEEHNPNINVVDVRDPEAYAKGHIPGAVNLPRDKWPTFAELKRDKLNILYCYSQVCHLAATAAVEFAGHGFPVMELEGGFDEWEEHELPIELPGPASLAA